MSTVDGWVLVVCSGANGRFRPLADWLDKTALRLPNISSVRVKRHAGHEGRAASDQMGTDIGLVGVCRGERFVLYL